MGRSRPYRNSSRTIPRIRKQRKVCVYEYGTDYDPRTDKTSCFVDIINGNSDLVDYVGFRFQPSGETHNIYKRSTVELSDGSKVRRFILKQSSVENWSKKVTIAVFGRGGACRVRHLRAKPKYFRERSLTFLEPRRLRSYYNVAPDFQFGIELETSFKSGTTSSDVVDAIRRKANVVVLDKTDFYRRGSEDNYSSWQLVPDASTACNRSDPGCNKIELVSRILEGEEGLNECRRVIDALEDVGKVGLNKSMGFHVHVDASNLSLERVKNICLNFVKHESAMDSIMPTSRKVSGYCRSNRDAVHENNDGLKHNAIVSCFSFSDLCDTINPGQPKEARYYKLNLQNLHPERKSKKQAKSTIEFRQHSSTMNFNKIEAWVRFCTAFCKNSMERPQKLHAYENDFESLFDTVIQDIKLKDYYQTRRMELMADHQHAVDNGNEGKCCASCAKGGGSCEATDRLIII
mmetsp:Transcript_8413/g.17456  ORF Transcript_8413/g.17456 Transcript_8413/m.17456 type:complete len:461 (+) Transcript_8413:139-1521(+)